MFINEEFIAEWLDNMETTGPYGVTGDVVDLADTIECALQAWENQD